MRPGQNDSSGAEYSIDDKITKYLIEFRMHEDPPVIHLAVLLPDKNPVYLDPGLDGEALHERMENARSTLMRFFEYNRENMDGRHLLYQDFLGYARVSFNKWAAVNRAK